MKTIKLTYPHDLEKRKLPPTVATIGFFDGVHIGHQTLIKTAVKEAKNKKMKSAVITFHPHPTVVLKGNQAVKYITTNEEKRAILESFSVDYQFIITFDRDLSQLSPQKFIDHFIKKLHIKHLIAGFDFTFGYQGKGNMKNISQYTTGEFTVAKVPKVKHNEQEVSSTKIRKALASGNVEQAKNFLQRFYRITGIVVRGDQRGREIGFPTANLKVNPDKLLPKKGVYAVQVKIDENLYHGMANIGIRPTFTDETEPTVEVYIFDFHHNIYNHKIMIDFVQFIREEKKFSSIDAIVSQLEQDEETIRRLL